MDSQHPSPDRTDDLAALVRERFDEPQPQPSVQDVVEGVAAALQGAVELAEPMQTSARTLTLLTRIQAAADGHIDADELLRSLERLSRGWHS